MKKLVLIFLLLIGLNLISASITIKDFQKKEFKIGEKIDTSAIININTEEQYFLTAEIFCTSYNLDFYKIPINENTNYADIPSLDINKNFLGECQIKLKILDSDNNIIEERESKKIIVKNKLNLEFTTDKENYNPEETVIIKGKSEKDSKLTIIFSDDKEVIEQSEEIISTEIFSRNIKLSDVISSGTKKILIKAKDKYGNDAETQKEIKISQVPKSIILEIDNKEINPYEEIIFNTYILDQSDIKINSEISYRIFDTESNIIKSLTSSEKNNIKLENPPPGEYLIKAVYKNLEDSDKFSVKEFRKIELSTGNGVIIITNKGNVRYTDNIEAEAKTENITYKIPIALDLKLNEKVFIDLKNELPSNNYDLVLNSEKENYNLSDIKVDDNRPVVKKLSQGISQITGSSVIETDEIANVFYLGFSLVFIGFIIIFIIYKKFKKKITEVVENTVVIQGKQNRNLKNSLDNQKKEKNIIREMFGSYVDHDILKKDFKSEIIKKEISILFTDIRGFSKIFDKKDSEKITEMLNLYFTKSSEIIKKNKGFVNKFIGDSVMALFNATSKDDNHLINSIRSALEIKREMVYLNNRLKERNIDSIEVGIGIDSGICAVGTIGSKEKLEFTAIGSPVNIAFRLQSLSEGSILITERVYKKIENKIKAEYFGEYEMKNITGKIKIYKVLDIR